MIDELVTPVTRDGQGVLLGWLKDGLNVAPGGNIKLFKAGFVPTQGSTTADFDAQEADFSGYNPGTLNIYTGPFQDSDDQSFLEGKQMRYTAADPLAVTNEIGGAWVESTGNDSFEYVVFNQPLLVVQPNQSFTLQHVVRADGTSTIILDQ